MALEIHENFYQLLRLKYTPNQDYVKVVTINGTTEYTRSTTSFFYNKVGAFESYNSSVYQIIRVGSGNRSTDADYYLGSELSNIQKHATSASASYDDTSKLINWTMTAAGINNNPESISITEIGLTASYRDSSWASSEQSLIAYEHLDTPIVVEPGAYFKVDMTINIQM